MKLSELIARLKAAQQPEDVFDGTTEDAIKMSYREQAKLTHPDGHKSKKGKQEAEEAFKLLNEWHTAAAAKFRAGHWGDRTWMKPVEMKTKKHTYRLTRRLPGGDISNVYVGQDGDTFAVKVCRNPANNDLLDNEREILSYLWQDARTKGLKAMAHIVKFHESMELAAGPMRKRVNVCYLANGYHTLAEVATAFPGGIDLRDAAWMFNRLLGGILIAQQAGVVHNAILPEHVLVHVGKHNVRLCGWSYATKGKVPVTAYVARRASWYPPEVLAKKPTTTATDLFMAAKTVLSIIDPATMPRNISGVFKMCLLAQRNRPQDAWALFEEFGVELERAFGPKVFRPFLVPVAPIAMV